MVISANKLRHRLAIERPPTKEESGRDSLGRKKGNWVEIAEANAEIVRLSGDEAEKARQLSASATHQITIRVRSTFTLTTKHRFVFRGRVFNIGDVNDTAELGSDWVTLCSEEKA